MTATMTTGITRANGVYATHARSLLSARVLLTGGGPVTLAEPVIVSVVGYGGAHGGAIVTSSWAVEVVDGPCDLVAPRVKAPSFAEDGSPVAGDPGWDRVRAERTVAPTAYRYATRSRVRGAGAQ